MNSEKERKKTKKAKLFGFRYLLYDFIKWTGAWSALFALRPRIYYTGKAAKKKVRGAAIVIANHESYLDPIKMQMPFWYRRMHIVATSELFKSKRGNWFFRKLLCIPVNKKKFGLSSFREIINNLDEGHLVGIFPEGELKHSSDIKNFKSGVALMAMKRGVPIIPIYIKRPEHWYKRQRIVVGEPILMEKYEGVMPTAEMLNEISCLLREKEIELMEFLRNKQKSRKEKKSAPVCDDGKQVNVNHDGY